MKRFILASAVSLAFLCTACTQPASSVSSSPSPSTAPEPSASTEPGTAGLLRPYAPDDEEMTAVFQMSDMGISTLELNEDVESAVISADVRKDGAWQKQDHFYLSKDAMEHYDKIAVRPSGTSFSVFLITPDWQYNELSFPIETEAPGDNDYWTYNMRNDIQADLEEPAVLYARFTDDSTKMEVHSIVDYKSYDWMSGYAVNITFYDHDVEPSLS